LFATSLALGPAGCDGATAVGAAGVLALATGVGVSSFANFFTWSQFGSPGPSQFFTLAFDIRHTFSPFNWLS